MTATATQLQQLYIAYFGRAADPEGIDYWVSAGTTLKQFAAHMDGQKEWIAVKSSLTTSEHVDQLYQNLFNRNADADGKAYWTKQVDDGVIKLAELGEYLRSSAMNFQWIMNITIKQFLQIKQMLLLQLQRKFVCL